MDIRRAERADEVEAAADLFDDPPVADATARFLAEPGHHLLLAWEDGVPVGMVSGVELVHPDKGAELFLYELGVADAAQGRGLGRALVAALAALGRERGCSGMWVLTEVDNAAALRAYGAAGGRRLADPAYLEWRFAEGDGGG